MNKNTPPSKEKLRELNESIWTKKYIQRPHGRRLKLTKIYDECRSLTEAEWDYIKKSVKALELPVVMSNSAYGFGVAIRIYEPPVAPTVPCELLLAITQKHFEEKFNQGWDRFYPLINTKRNLELIDFCGLPKLLKKSYYEY